MPNIRIQQAVIAAQPPMCGVSGFGVSPGTVRVFQLGDPRADHFDWTVGACNAEWRDNPDDQLITLWEIERILVGELGLRRYAVEGAFQRVREYRQARIASRSPRR